MRICRTRHHSRASDGQVLILFALFSLVLVGFMALAVDVGYLLAERRQAQSAADAGVLAAAASALADDPATVVTKSGKDYGALNADVDADSVEVHRPPVSGQFEGDDDYLQVVVTKDVERYFLGAIYQGDWSVQASATAGIEPDPFNAAILALNSDGGGIETGGSTRMHVDGGSIVSNYDIDTSGSTRITATEWVTANDGFSTSGNTVISGDKGENPNAPEIPDPLQDRLDPPDVPTFPSNPVPNVSNAVDGGCREYNPWTEPVTDTVPAATYDEGGGNCVNVNNVPSEGLTFADGDWVFRNGAGIRIQGGNSGDIVLDGGTYNFEGGPGIDVGGSTPHFEMRAGDYSFEDGATIKIAGSAPNNILGAGGTDADDSHFYFTDGSDFSTGGSNHVTLNPGTYVFDGGDGLSMSGSSQLNFNPGTYEFWFGDGAGMQFRGSSRIGVNGDVQVKMYFYGTSSDEARLQMSGSTSFSIPPGQYIFDRGAFINSGSSLIAGEDVFLYFADDSYLRSTGSASFGFTAPEDEIYPGYYPGVFMYSDRDNTAEFRWHGSTSATSKGIIYLPGSPLIMSGASSGKVFEGQIIADRFDLSGSNSTDVEFVEHVPTDIPQVYLVE